MDALEKTEFLSKSGNMYWSQTELNADNFGLGRICGEYFVE